jgi:ferrous-iron efflux pump FieF
MGPIAGIERTRERSILIGVSLDAILIALMTITSLWSGSLTMLSEVIRAVLLLQVEIFGLVMLRKINRMQLGAYDFGTGKLEQAVNMLIAVAMIGGAAWILLAAYGRANEVMIPSPIGLTVTAVIGELNLLLNIWAFIVAFRASRDGLSVITTAYCRSRLVKLVASCIVLLALVVSARTLDPGISLAADAIGSCFVACFMIFISVRMLREGLPDLLDRTLGEAQQLHINQVLAHRFDDYDSLVAVHTRRAGKELHVDILLGFDPGRTIGEIEKRARAMKAELARLLPGAIVSIVPSSATPVPA